MKYLISILVLVIILTPQFKGISLPIRLEDIVAVLFLLSALLTRNFKINIDKNFRIIIILFLAFICINFLSLSSAVFQGYQSNIRDYNTILLYVKSIIFLISGYLIRQKLVNVSGNQIIFFFTAPLITSSILALVQYFDIAGLQEIAYSFYDDGSYKLSRAIGAMGNPNYAAYYHGVAFLLLLAYKPSVRKFNIIKFLLLALTFLSVMVTFSRTGLIALLISWLFYLIINKKIKNLIAIIFLFFIIVIVYLDKIIKGTRFEIILSNSESSPISSFGGRTDLIWQSRFEQFLLHPFIGSGPGKNSISNTIFGSAIYDNTYILLLVTSGAFGLILYTFIMFKFISYDLFRQTRLLSNRQKDIKIISTIGLYTLLFFFTVDLVWNVKFVSYFYLLFGLYMSHIYHQNYRYNS